MMLLASSSHAARTKADAKQSHSDIAAVGIGRPLIDEAGLQITEKVDEINPSRLS